MRVKREREREREKEKERERGKEKKRERGGVEEEKEGCRKDGPKLECLKLRLTFIQGKCKAMQIIQVADGTNRYTQAVPVMNCSK